MFSPDHYAPLMLFCACGEPPDQISAIGLTPGHELVLQWKCSECHDTVTVLKDLAECWRECPPTPSRGLVEVSEPRELQAEDFSFLKRLGIAVEGEWGGSRRTSDR